MTYGFGGICTGLASTATGSLSAVIGPFPESSALMSSKAFAAARFVFLLADLDRSLGIYLTLQFILIFFDFFNNTLIILLLKGLFFQMNQFCAEIIA